MRGMEEKDLLMQQKLKRSRVGGTDKYVHSVNIFIVTCSPSVWKTGGAM